jgi:hypothetical protein
MTGVHGGDIDGVEVAKGLRYRRLPDKYTTTGK